MEPHCCICFNQCPKFTPWVVAKCDTIKQDGNMGGNPTEMPLGASERRELAICHPCWQMLKEGR